MLTQISISIRQVCLLTIFCAMCLTATGEIKLAAFNIRVFGEKKMQDPNVAAVLIKILARYDVVAVQEVRDIEGKSIPKLVQLLNDYTNKNYSYFISKREGRTTSKEQYAIIYLDNKIKIKRTYLAVDKADIFERSPLFLLMQPIGSSYTDFIWGVLHATPDDVRSELNAFYNETIHIQKKWHNKNVLLSGDFNADCSYLSNRAERSLKFTKDTKFYFFIRRGQDTTVAKSNCAYDRFIVSGDNMAKMIKLSSVGVFDFGREYKLSQRKTEAASDHYPIEMILDGAKLVKD